MIKFIDFFGGMGGFSEAARRTGGFECVGYYEKDSYAVDTYNANFNTNFSPVDIRNIGDFPDFDLLCAGFPCQSFSIAGKRKGFEDTRGTIFFEICRIADKKQPKYLLLENVKGLLSHDNGQTFRTILKSLDELGYDVQWQVLNSKYWVPQNRERVFILGFIRGNPRPEVFPITENGRQINGTHKETLIQQINNPKHSRNRIYDSNGLCPTLTAMQGGGRQPKIINFQPRSADRPSLLKNKNAGGSGILMKDNETFSIDTTCSQGIIEEGKIRRLSPIECERLQGFPDNWTKGDSDSQRYKQIGNSITVPVVEVILRRLKLWVEGISAN